MSLLQIPERPQAEALAEIGNCNPFTAQRIALERIALGADFPERPGVRQRRRNQSPREDFVVSQAVEAAAGKLLDQLRARLLEGTRATPAELTTYQRLAFVVLYYRTMGPLFELIQAEEAAPETAPHEVSHWPAFQAQFRHYLELPQRTFPQPVGPAHALALMYQVERAYYYIFEYLVGGSHAAARLRAAVWESIFTHDMARYARALYGRMGDVPTLITGPSGSGKGLVARAIGMSRYLPFDPQTRRFAAPLGPRFLAVNLAAFAPSLVESELFGHVRGAYTGAVADRVGLLEACDPRGAVFLDEIGEVDPLVQVKLLRVLQERTFQRAGETGERIFRGKVLAATNRDLTDEIRQGRFREDLYYRLCADLLTTPSLREQLADCPDDLPNLVNFVAAGVVGDFACETDQLTTEVVAWIGEHLGADYPWPGNFRELEQCVRNIMIRRNYQPQAFAAQPPDDAPDSLAAAVAAGQLTSDELLERYYRLVYQQCGSYRAAARRLNVDWRTVKERLNP